MTHAKPIDSGEMTFRLGVSRTVDGGVAKGKGEAPDPPDLSVDIFYTRVDAIGEFFHQVNHKFAFGVTPPWYHVTSRNNQTGEGDTKSGYQDLGGYVIWWPWEEPESHGGEDPLFSLHNFSVLGGLTLPTADERTGPPPAYHFAQDGLGSINFRLALTYMGAINDSLYAFGSSEIVVDTSTSTSGLRNGNTYAFSIGAAWKATSWAFPFALYQAEVKDHSIQSGTILTDSSGVFWIATLGVSLTPIKNIAVDIEASLPFYHRVGGQQTLAGNSYTIGVTYQW